MLGKRSKDHKLIHTVKEFGPKRALELGLYAALDLAIRKSRFICRRKAHRRGFRDLARANIGRHDDHRVGKIYHTTLPIGQTSFFENLKEHVKNVGMCFFDFVKKYHRIGPAADCFGELSALVKAHVSRRRTHKLGYLVLFHKFAHVKGNKRILRAKQKLGQGLCELGFSHARRTQKDE